MPAVGGAVAVNLRTAGDYVILAESGISTVAPSVITGDLGISPMTATSVTGFALIADSTNVFSTSTQVTGKVYGATDAVPTPANLIAAIGDMGLAFTDAAGRAADFTELGAGNIGGMTLAPGVYKWGSALLIPTDLTLNGSATGVWIFQVAQTLTVSNAVAVHLYRRRAGKERLLAGLRQRRPRHDLLQLEDDRPRLDHDRTAPGRFDRCRAGNHGADRGHPSTPRTVTQAGAGQEPTPGPW